MNTHVRSSLLLALLSIAMITQIGASCMNTDSDTRPRDGDLESTTQIPRDARMAAEGSGQLSYAPRSDGRVYLYDVTDRTVLDSRPIRRDETYSVDPDANKIQLDRRTVSQRDLKRKNDHRIYFRSDETSDRDDRNDNLNVDRLPRNAKSVATGTGEITYRVRDRGRIYVYDADNERVLLARDVHDGQSVLVDPGKDRVLIDGKKVYDDNLERKHAHRIYFEKD
ncbi:MAG: hypothetical protein H7Z14_21705 [Anaerolineae bacterium]|nr:hypothetical protein [Phycisphaerae bacterium]